MNKLIVEKYFTLKPFQLGIYIAKREIPNYAPTKVYLNFSLSMFNPVEYRGVKSLRGMELCLVVNDRTIFTPKVGVPNSIRNKILSGGKNETN